MKHAALALFALGIIKSALGLGAALFMAWRGDLWAPVDYSEVVSGAPAGVSALIAVNAAWAWIACPRLRPISALWMLVAGGFASRCLWAVGLDGIPCAWLLVAYVPLLLCKGPVFEMARLKGARLAGWCAVLLPLAASLLLTPVAWGMGIVIYGLPLLGSRATRRLATA